MNRIFCKLTGGHKWDCKDVRIEPAVDILMNVTHKCKKCGATCTNIIPVYNRDWEKRIKEVEDFEKYGVVR